AARMVTRLIPQALIAAGPKWVVGFSDITALFAYLHAQIGLAVMHGPSLAAPSAATSPLRDQNLAALKQALFEPDHRPDYAAQWLRAPSGKVPISGRLVGGNLAVLVTTLGTPWEVNTRDAILFLEDTSEAPYRIDRMITHLRTARKLEQVQAVVFGHL